MAVSSKPSSSQEFYKEDHYTGADYLALQASGEYELIGREHMGVWVLERGTWVAEGDTLNFSPLEPKGKKPYVGTRTDHGQYRFLLWSNEDAAGMVVPADEVKRHLDKGKSMPPYVFFRISEDVFRNETGRTYPFKFRRK
jgi:hypothetical protein